MIRVVICDPDPKTRVRMRRAVERCAANEGVHNVGCLLVADVAAVVERTIARRPGFIDLALVRVEGGDREVALVEKASSIMHERGCPLPFVLVSTNADYAYDSYRLGMAGFIPLPTDMEGFGRVVSGLLRAAAERKAELRHVKSLKGIDGVPIADVLFVESSKKGPIIHMSGDRTVDMRGSLQNLLDTLLDDERFAKAGGSFIVNLDNVRSFGEGSVVFPDGQTIIVPARARKPLQDDLDAYTKAS